MQFLTLVLSLLARPLTENNFSVEFSDLLITSRLVNFFRLYELFHLILKVLVKIGHVIDFLLLVLKGKRLTTGMSLFLLNHVFKMILAVAELFLVLLVLKVMLVIIDSFQFRNLILLLFVQLLAELRFCLLLGLF